MHKPATFCRIDEHCLLLVKGTDARKFLQGQVTCDIDELSLNKGENNLLLSSSLGAHCTHKGRIVFSFRALPLDEQTIALCIPSEMLDIATAALKKYIVFSKAELIDAREQYQLLGINIDRTADIDNDKTLDSICTMLAIDSLPSEANTAIKTANGIILCLSPMRYELWLSTEQAEKMNAILTDTIFENNNYWDLANTNAGLAEIRVASSGAFTPHAISFHTTANAVSFQKGCYTGQEVVARMHYLGKLKRQMFLFDLSVEDISTQKTSVLPCIGDSVYTTEKTQAIGEIILVANTKECTRLLVSVTIEQAEANQVFINQECSKKIDLLTFNQ
ncbi:MAG: folate-binding protein YgfZ [Kiritimatiellia bacterium]|jgi:folate-binding protein YgfZ